MNPPVEDTLSIIDKNSFLSSDHSLGYSKIKNKKQQIILNLYSI
jgi:hypothetical protein